MHSSCAKKLARHVHELCMANLEGHDPRVGVAMHSSCAKKLARRANLEGPPQHKRGLVPQHKHMRGWSKVMCLCWQTQVRALTHAQEVRQLKYGAGETQAQTHDPRVGYAYSYKFGFAKLRRSAPTGLRCLLCWQTQLLGSVGHFLQSQ
jgi:hypothetical protein